VETVYSFSSIDRFLKCPRWYYYYKVLRLPQTPTIHLERGSAVHLYIQKSIEGADPEKALQDFISQSLVLKHEAEPEKEIREMAHNFLDRFTPRGNVMVEKKFCGRIGSRSIETIVDMVEVDNGVLTITDFKTNRKQYEPTDTLQLPLYAHVLLQQPEFQNVRQVIARLWFVRFKTKKSAVRQAVMTREVMDGAVSQALAAVERIEQALKWPAFIGFDAQPGRWCEWCEFPGYCMGMNLRLCRPETEQEARELAGQVRRLDALAKAGKAMLQEYLEKSGRLAVETNEEYTGLYPKYEWKFRDNREVISALEAAGLDPNAYIEWNGWRLRRLLKNEKHADVAEKIQALGECTITRYFGHRDSPPEE